jgi:uncharacterized protein (TIGR02266 family)
VHRARRYDRIDTRLRCWCEGDGVTFYARMANLSEGGLFVRTRTPLGVGAQVTVRFEARPGTEISARARVMWTRPDGMGLRFDYIDEAALAVIRRIIDNDSLSKEMPEGDPTG